MLLTEDEIDVLTEKRRKFEPLVEDESAPKLDSHMKGVIYQLYENTAREMNLNEDTRSSDVQQFTPVIMSLIRRVPPTLVGTQMIGVQAMTAPTGRIFAQHVWGNSAGAVNRNSSGVITADTTTTEMWGNSTWSDKTSALTTAAGEQLGNTGGGTWGEMSFSIDYIDVSVKTRALKGKLTTEIISDLKAVHGLDAESEIVNILNAEIVAEIDREIVGRIVTEAKYGAQNCTTAGTFNFSTDADGRWSMEKVQGLLIQIEREATLIAQDTRRGRGNFIITSPEVAAYLSMANLISNDYGNTGFTPVVNPVGVSYYGMLCGRFKVYVDPYQTATNNLHRIVVGYKGTNDYDSGLFYCPYVPFQFFKATGVEDFGLRLGIKSRYGLVSSPWYAASGTNAASDNSNAYYRKFDVKF